MSIYCLYHQYMGGRDLIIHSNDVDINILNSNSVSNSYLRSNGNIIECESDNFLIENNDVVKEQGDYNIVGDSIVEFNDFNIIHVSKDKGDFNSLSQALSSLGKLNPDLKYLIRIHTGRYIENDSIVLSGKDNVSIIGDSKENTTLVLNSLDDRVLFNCGSGLIEGLRIEYKNKNLLANQVSIFKFTGSSVNINNLDFVLESCAVKVIEIVSCNSVNKIRNVSINLKYLFNNSNISQTSYGIYADTSRVLDLSNLEINITPSEDFTNGNSKSCVNMYLKDTRITSKDLKLEMTTELNNSHLVLLESELDNDYTHEIFGNSLLLNTNLTENYIIKKSINDEKCLIVNCNILGQFDGTNIFTSGSVVSNNNTVHSYHTSLLSNDKDSILIGNDAGKSTMGNSGAGNTLIGKQAGQNITSGDENVLLGNQTGNNLTTQGNNTLIGFKSGFNLEQDGSVMIGYKSGFNTRDKNLFVGSYSGYNITGGNNIVLGNFTVNETIQNKINNIFIGNDLGLESSTSSNIFIGEGSGRQTQNNQNINIGNFISSNDTYNNQNLETDGNNINIGHLAGRTATDNDRNINIGGGAGEENSGDDNINIGYRTGKINTGNNNLLLGNETGTNILGESNIAGNNSLKGGSVSNNLVIGKDAGEFVESSENIILGNQSGRVERKKIGNNNILLGLPSG